MSHKKEKDLPRQRTYTFRCEPCLITIKIDINDKDYKNMKSIACPLCGRKIK